MTAALLWARIVFQAWRHEVRERKRDPTVIAVHILARHAQRRRQRELLQRWASDSRDARTAAATRLIAERCHAALASAILDRRASLDLNSATPTSADGSDESSASYEPLQIGRRCSNATLPAVSFAPTSCADEAEEVEDEYTPFEPTSTCVDEPTSPRTTKAASSRRARRHHAPVDVESIAVSTAHLIHRLVGRLHGATEWLSRAAAAAAEAEACAGRAHSTSVSAPATPPSGWRSAVPHAIATAAKRAILVPDEFVATLRGEMAMATSTLSKQTCPLGQKHASRCLLDDAFFGDAGARAYDEDATMDTCLAEHEHEHEHSHKLGVPPPSPLRALCIGGAACD